MSNSCLFCGAKGAGVLTNEHVVPQWLLRHLGLPTDDQLFQGVASTATQTLVQPARVHASVNFVQGHVCQECNNGWMSRLEVAATPILISLIDRQRTTESLAAEERLTVSKWVVKTAYMLSWAAPLKKRVQLDHLMALNGDGGTPLSRVGVFGMQSEFKQAFSYFLTGHWPHFTRPDLEVSHETPAEAYKIGLQFRHLHLLTAFWPDPKSLFTLAKGLGISVITANQADWPAYSADFTVGEGPVDRLALFCKTLGITHP